MEINWAKDMQILLLTRSNERFDIPIYIKETFMG